jgi:hypothetical protein
MGISFVAGQMLQSNLNRAGSDLTFSNANVTIGKITISNAGNIDANSVSINNLLDPAQNQDAATKYYVDQHIGNVSNIGNLSVSNTTITTSLVNGNITITPTGNAFAYINTTTGLVIPVGNTAQRPATGNTAGTVRFNTDSAEIEVYDGAEWDSIVSDVTNQIIVPDGSSLVYTLNKSSTAAGILVSINGLIQIPGVSYSYTVSGNQITFADAPLVSDIIDIRFL